jgi:hypothetical protein
MTVKVFDVFISYSSSDNLIASAIKHHLEEAKVRCWMAPDNIPAGASWPLEIMKGIQGSSVMLLLWTKNSMNSKEVAKELTLCMQENLLIFPFRAENIPPSGEWAYHLSNTHWMDAYDGKIEKHIAPLVSRIKSIIPQRAGGESYYASNLEVTSDEVVVQLPRNDISNSKYSSIIDKYAATIKDSKIILRSSKMSVFMAGEKAQKIVESIATGVSVRDVIAYVDDTVFGSGVDGMILTDEALWIKNGSRQPVSYRLEEIQTLDFKGMGMILAVNGKDAIGFTQASRGNLNNLAEMLRELTGARESTAQEKGYTAEIEIMDGENKVVVKKHKWLAYLLVLLFGLFGYFYTSWQRTLGILGLWIVISRFAGNSDAVKGWLILLFWWILPLLAIKLWNFRPGFFPARNK